MTAEAMDSHAGQPRRRSSPIIGLAVTVSTSARRTGPRIMANAFMPATATTVAASPSRTITPRGRVHSPGPLLPDVSFPADQRTAARGADRKSTRLNSSHVENSYAGFCLKKKKKEHKYEARDQNETLPGIAKN